MRVGFTLNGIQRDWDVHPGERLVDAIRSFGLMGTKYGCGTGECGACVVLLDGRPVNSCLVMIPHVEGREVTTIEGIGTALKPHALQEEFARSGAVQCGFCTPGMVLSAYALLEKHSNPSREEILRSLDGNLCRCTGYLKIVEAVEAAAHRLRKERDHAP